MVKKAEPEDSNVSSRQTVTTIFAFIALVFIFKILWGLTIPDLFPGAVEQGLVADTLTRWTAIKISLFVTLIMGLANWTQSGGAFRFKE